MVGILCGGLKVNDNVEGEGGTVVYQLNAAVRHSLVHFYANVESLHCGREGVHVGGDHFPLVFGEHLYKVGKVCKGHIQLVGLAGHGSVLTFDIGHN